MNNTQYHDAANILAFMTGLDVLVMFVAVSFVAWLTFNLGGDNG